jgi:predicted flap endonuclease-1-like 5' DNA nuclease
MHYSTKYSHHVAKSSVRLPTACCSLPISKLRGVSAHMRMVLKARRVTTCERLLDIAGKAGDRSLLACSVAIDADDLLHLVQQADMTRISGIGTVFGMMLADLGVRDVPALAASDPVELHDRIRAYNQAERIARRSPTPEEVADWIGQAQALPRLVTY